MDIKSIFYLYQTFLVLMNQQSILARTNADADRKHIILINFMGI